MQRTLGNKIIERITSSKCISPSPLCKRWMRACQTNIHIIQWWHNWMKYAVSFSIHFSSSTFTNKQCSICTTWYLVNKQCSVCTVGSFTSKQCSICTFWTFINKHCSTFWSFINEQLFHPSSTSNAQSVPIGIILAVVFGICGIFLLMMVSLIVVWLFVSKMKGKGGSQAMKDGPKFLEPVYVDAFPRGKHQLSTFQNEQIRVAGNVAYHTQLQVLQDSG